MYYLGIVGACSSLGMRMITELEKYPSKFRVVFKVDSSYPKKNLLTGEFRTLEQVFAHGIVPSLVLDFDQPLGALERAKFYRSYSMPAIMQHVFGSKGQDILESLHGLSGDSYVPLVLIPDFSTLKTQMFKHIRGIVEAMAYDISQLRINILYSANRYYAPNQWIYWAQCINHILGRDYEPYSLQGEILTCGAVKYNFIDIKSLDVNEESISVQVLSQKENVIINSELCCDLLDSRVDGIIRVLNWYFSLKFPFIGCTNNIYTDKLFELI